MAFLGCSRGLGKEVCLLMNSQKHATFSLLSARNQSALALLGEQLQQSMQIHPCDFSVPEQTKNTLAEIRTQRIERVFYFAGGGPYGPYAKKQWKDHMWSFQVNFLTPAELLLHLLKDADYSHVRQIVFVGSLVADSKGDPQAASYAAGKHALKGLIDSIHLEGCAKDLRLFRPSYMDTDMLPPSSAPRRIPGKVMNITKSAQIFVDWVLDPRGAKSLDMGSV